MGINESLNAKMTSISLILLGLIILTSFQNCGTQDFNNSLVQPSGLNVDSSTSDQIPFAFDFNANQISYMSCSRTNDSKDNISASTTHLNNSNTFFTFKVGAYDYSGLTLRQDFINYVKSTYTFKGVLEDQKIKDALTLGSAHKGAALQLSFRDTTPIVSSMFAPSALTSSSNKMVRGIDYGLFPFNSFLTTTEFLPQMVNLFKNPNQRISTLGTGAISYKLESALHFEQLSEYTESGAQQIRNFVSSDSSVKYLSLTYSNDLESTGGPPSNALPEYFARSANPELSNNLVWGTGFKVKFTSPIDMKFYRVQKNNVLSSVQETNLSVLSQSNNSGWTCPDNLRFIIVSPKDRFSTYPCQEPAINTLNSTQLNIYNQVRRQLPSDQWGIDVANQCIYPKQAGADCYGGSNIKPIDYSNSNTSCGYDTSTNKYLDKICAEFLSVCYRIN